MIGGDIITVAVGCMRTAIGSCRISFGKHIAAAHTATITTTTISAQTVAI